VQKRLLVALLSLSWGPWAWAKPTVSGNLESVNGNLVVIRNDETGMVWRAELQPGSKCEWYGRGSSLSSIPKGSKVMLRVAGSMGDRPLKVDLVCDWSSSSKHVDTVAKVPYYTKKGEWAGPGGIGGRDPNAPDPGKQKNVGGYAANGGMPHQNQPDVPNILAPAQQNPGNGKMAPGTPGFQSGPVPPPNQPMNNPGQPPIQDAAMFPSQPMNGVNPVTGMPYQMQNPQDPYANPALPQTYNPYGPNMNTSSQMDSILNPGDGEQPEQGGPMFPGGGMGVGMPVQMQATVLRSDPATRSLVVQAVGSQIPQNIMLGGQMMLPALREGQMVMINGSSHPHGYIEAQQITPLGQ
jgi:hypothetical protein